MSYAVPIVSVLQYLSNTDREKVQTAYNAIVAEAEAQITAEGDVALLGAMYFGAQLLDLEGLTPAEMADLPITPLEIVDAPPPPPPP